MHVFTCSALVLPKFWIIPVYQLFPAQVCSIHIYLADYNEPIIGLTGKLLIFIRLPPGHKTFTSFLGGHRFNLGILYLIVLVLVLRATMRAVVTRQQSVT